MAIYSPSQPSHMLGHFALIVHFANAEKPHLNRVVALAAVFRSSIPQHSSSGVEVTQLDTADFLRDRLRR